jgi:hypothetical protein
MTSLRALVGVVLGSLVLAASVPAMADAGDAGGPATSAAGRTYRTGPGGLPVLEPLPELDTKKAEAAATVAVNAPDTTETTRFRLGVAAVVCGGVGLASMGTGLYYWSQARSYSDSANRTVIYRQSAYDDGKHAETMQWIFYGVGAAAIATGAGLYIYSRWFLAPKPATVSLAPTVAPGLAGLAAVGTF